MSPLVRLLLATLVVPVILLAASCGQKGPLRLPEESGARPGVLDPAPSR